MILEAVVRRFAKQGSGSQLPLGLTEQGNLRVAVAEPFHKEMLRANRRFAAVVGSGATFKAPVTSVPTTTATWALYNGEPAGGRSYLIHSAAAFLASGTSGAGGALIAAVQQTAATTVPSAYASTIISSVSGRNNASKAVLANAYTIVGTQPAWHVIGKSEAAAAATIGANVFYALLEGAYLVPPGGVLALDVLSGTGTTALYGVSVVWDEIEVDLEG